MISKGWGWGRSPPSEFSEGPGYRTIMEFWSGLGEKRRRYRIGRRGDTLEPHEGIGIQVLRNALGVPFRPPTSFKMVGP
jgi:hypothetical protein